MEVALSIPNLTPDVNLTPTNLAQHVHIDHEIRNIETFDLGVGFRLPMI